MEVSFGCTQHVMLSRLRRKCWFQTDLICMCMPFYLYNIHIKCSFATLRNLARSLHDRCFCLKLAFQERKEREKNNTPEVGLNQDDAKLNRYTSI